MSQEFNDEVAQVAGNDIINHNTIVNIHLPADTQLPDKSAEIHRHTVHLLLKSSDEIEARKAIERLAYKIFGSSLFKDLSLDDLAKLQLIVDEMKLVKNKIKPPSYSVGDVFLPYLKRLALWLPFL